MSQKQSEALRYYYGERGIDVVGCCEFEQGYYCGYNQNGGLKAEFQGWLDMRTAKRLTRDLLVIVSKFGVQNERDSVQNILNEFIALDVPFGYLKRFPIDSSYLLATASAITNILANIAAAAAWKDRNENKESAVTTPGSGKSDTKAPDAKVSDWKFDDAQTAYAKQVRKLLDVVNDGTYIYDRDKFESTYKFLWCNGEPRCPKPVHKAPCYEEPRNGDDNNNPSDCPICPKPPPCDGTTYKSKELKNLIDEKKIDGTTYKDWSINNLDFHDPSCDAYYKSSLLKDLDDKIKVPYNGFAFRLIKENTDKKDDVAVIRFDLNEKSILKLQNVTCDHTKTVTETRDIKIPKQVKSPLSAKTVSVYLEDEDEEQDFSSSSR